MLLMIMLMTMMKILQWQFFPTVQTPLLFRAHRSQPCPFVIFASVHDDDNDRDFDQHTIK